MLGKYFGKPQRAADKWLLFLSIDFFTSWTEVQRVNLLWLHQTSAHCAR